MTRHKKFTQAHLDFMVKLSRMTSAIAQQSAANLFEEANTPEGQGGRMPVDFGFLVNSRTGAVGSMPRGPSRPTKRQRYKSPVGMDPALVILRWDTVQPLFLGWTAAYALRMEYGFTGTDSLGRTYSMQGKAFARTAAQNWQSHVDAATKTVLASPTWRMRA